MPDTGSDVRPEAGMKHEHKVAQLLDDLETRSDGRLVHLDWSTGLVIAARTG